MDYTELLPPLPELPEPDGFVDADYEYQGPWPTEVGDRYTVAQLRAYGQACADAARAAATPEPIYAKSVVRRLATQMGWKPPGAAAPQSVEPVADLTEWVAKAMRLADNLVMTRGHSAAKADFRAHLSTMPQEEGWRPIETAPTGKVHSPPLHAIVASPLDDGSLYVEEAWFDNERREWWPANVEFTDAHGSAIYPTHWRPLPEPPKGGE